MTKPSRAVLVVVAGASLLPSFGARAAEKLPRQLQDVDVVERLGEEPALAGKLIDHEGRTRRVSELFDGRRPVLVTFNYYRCKTLCNLQLGWLSRSLGELEWFDESRAVLATISIDPRETPEDAAARRQRSLSEAGRDDIDWTFFVGEKQTVRDLAEQLGVTYRYDEQTDQYAHPATVAVLSPDGVVTRYLHGLESPPRDIRLAVLEASDGVVGTPFDRIVLSCYSYDAAAGSYVPVAWRIMRLAGVATVLLLGGFLALLWRRDRAAQRRRDAAGNLLTEAA